MLSIVQHGAHMIVIGLTGGIGTGKTEVARILRELGAAVVNADLAAHEAYSKGSEGWAEIVAAFGEGVLTAEGSVDRSKLAALVFKDERALTRLNSIVHPRAPAPSWRPSWSACAKKAPALPS